MSFWKRYVLGLGIIFIIVLSAISLSRAGENDNGNSSNSTRNSFSDTSIESYSNRLLETQKLYKEKLNVIPTPTPAPTPNPTPTSMLPLPTPTSTPTPKREGLVALVHETFPDDPYMGNVVVWRETLNYPDGVWQGYVYGETWSVTSDCGLLQVHWPSHYEKFTARGWTQQDCFDPVKNLVIAREIYDESGPSAWTTYY